MKLLFVFLLVSSLSFCQEFTQEKLDSLKQTGLTISDANEYYKNNKGDSLASKSIGTVSKGQLVNGKLIPFEGKNFTYFDVLSYVNGRAFLNKTILDIVLEAYKKFETSLPCRHFYVMECSNQQGGKMFPHRTHQNGLSVDFMMPLLKNGNDYYELDTLGGDHYLLDFDKEGKYVKDKSVQIDFNLVAQHILLLDFVARSFSAKIEKVIINTDLKDELFNTEFGKILKTKDIYIVQNLSPLINALHDDHYHIDFKL